jgi:hypothetical protein
LFNFQGPVAFCRPAESLFILPDSAPLVKHFFEVLEVFLPLPISPLSRLSPGPSALEYNTMPPALCQHFSSFWSKFRHSVFVPFWVLVKSIGFSLDFARYLILENQAKMFKMP